MLRGHRTYLELFDLPTTTAEKPERRGRSEILHSKRNHLLIHRYYYHIKIEGKQYAKTLQDLEDELFIAQRTIIDTVAANRDLLKELNTIKPAVGYFRKKYPYMVW